VTLGALGRVALVGLAVWAVWPQGSSAWAYDFSIDLRTVGQGYQVRGYAPTGANLLLSRRRLTQTLNLSVFNLEPDRWHADDGAAGARGPRGADDRAGDNVLYVDASLRFDTDFGGYMLGRPTGTDEIRELQQSQVDVLYAFVGGRRMGGRVDFELGRQIHFDLVDFYAFDGASALVRATPALAAEAFGGTEVRGEAPVASPVFELDGTSAGSRDPATRPGQSSMLRPLAGAALVLGADGDLPVTARVAYRRLWSATADRLPGEPDGGVNDEKVAATASARWARRLFLTAGVRYNLLLAALDDEQVALRARVTARQWVGLEMAYLAPTFDGDSIWNVFASGAYRDLRGTWELGVGDGLKVYARAFARHFDAGLGEGASLGTSTPETRWAGGGSAGLAWRRERGVVRGDAYWDDGFGGRKVGGDLSGRWGLRARPVELEGRLTGYVWRSDQHPTTDTGFVVGAQAGARYRLGDGVRLHLLVEDNVGTFYLGQYRGLAVVEMNASL
jgi:hypothetical protein